MCPRNELLPGEGISTRNSSRTRPWSVQDGCIRGKHAGFPLPGLCELAWSISGKQGHLFYNVRYCLLSHDLTRMGGSKRVLGLKIETLDLWSARTSILVRVGVDYFLNCHAKLKEGINFEFQRSIKVVLMLHRTECLSRSIYAVDIDGTHCCSVF